MEPCSPGKPQLLRVALSTAVERRDLQGAISAAWELYYPAMRSLGCAMGVAECDVDDALHNAILRAAQGWPAFQGDGFVPWLFTLVRFEFLTERKRATRQARREAGDPDECGVPPDVFRSLEMAESRAQVAALLDGVDAISVRIFEALSERITDEALAAEITETFGVPITVGAIWSRRYRLRGVIAEAAARGSKP